MNSVATGGPLLVETKASLVRSRIESAIVSGALKPGDRIVVDEIARDLGISKIPVREALFSLQSAGLVVQTPHAGVRVAPLKLRELRAVYLLREETETLVARLAAGAITPRAIKALQTTNDQMGECLQRGEIESLADLNTEFHLLIARATTYESLVEAVTDSLRKVRRYRAVVSRLATDWTAAVSEHNEVIEALKTGDPDIAGAAVRAHVQNQRQIELAIELAKEEASALQS
ncbi:GntR family transcriptional regulator [Arthrobacter tecti]